MLPVRVLAGNSSHSDGPMESHLVRDELLRCGKVKATQQRLLRHQELAIAGSCYPPSKGQGKWWRQAPEG